MPPSITNPTAAEVLIDRLTETYRRPLEQVLRLGLWEPLIMIAGVYDNP
jgi:hypothetical protein